MEKECGSVCERERERGREKERANWFLARERRMDGRRYVIREGTRRSVGKVNCGEVCVYEQEDKMNRENRQGTNKYKQQTKKKFGWANEVR